MAKSDLHADVSVRVRKLRLTGKALEAGNFVAYPGFEADAALATDVGDPSVLDKLDAAERVPGRERRSFPPSSGMVTMGLNLETGINGVYNLFDKEGYHYCVYGGTRVSRASMTTIPPRTSASSPRRMSPTTCPPTSPAR